MLSLPAPERIVSGGYTGDLLSWVMGRAKQNNVWITIMTNVNIAAVAMLSDVSLVVLAEGVVPDEGVLETAREKGVNIVSSKLSAFDIAVGIAKDI